jgi:hypothetical protein
MKAFCRTPCFHGYPGCFEQSLLAIYRDHAALTGGRAFGKVILPELHFGRGIGCPA